MIIKVKVPKDSLASNYFDSYHYADAYQGVLNNSNEVTAIDVVKSFFTSTPPWVIWLLELRNSLVRLFGLKTASIKDIRKSVENFKGQVGESFADTFSVLSTGKNEILTGESDKHLDFCLSFLIIKKESGYQITLTTVVKFNGILGRLYFLPVKPMHKIIVKTMLKRMIKELEVLR